MYHYIGDEQEYKSGIYPVSVARLSDQLDKIGEKFDFISEADLTAAISRKAKLPEDSCLITFDDGLRCQFERALPVLQNKNIPAVFYPNTRPLAEARACVVHKVHYLLSRTSADILLTEVKKFHRQIAGRELEIEKIFKGINIKPGIYDQEPVYKLKYLINSHLEKKLSADIINNIFKSFYSDEAEFCRRWYMNKEQLVKIKNSQLFSLGLHTASHIDFSVTLKEKIADDLLNNLNYLKDELGMAAVNGISYPYGLISQSEVEEKIKPIAVEFGIKYGLTTHKGVNENLASPFFLKRFDTNDVVGGKKPIITF